MPKPNDNHSLEDLEEKLLMEHHFQNTQVLGVNNFITKKYDLQLPRKTGILITFSGKTNQPDYLHIL
jgi:hypothetical protein